MASEYDRLLRAVTNLQRAVANLVRIGTVHEVKKDKLRVIIGKDRNGKDALSPWYYTSNHRGGARETRFWKKGQNVMLVAPGGDWENALVLPYAPNKNFLRPDHANKSGQDEETYQLDDLRVKKTKDSYEIWLQPPKRQQQQDGDLTKLPENQDNGSDVKMKVRIHKNGGITGRVGKNRFMAHEKGAKIKAGRQFAVVTEKKLIISKEWEIGKDPIPDDDQ